MIRFIQALIGGGLFMLLWAASLETGDPVLYTLAAIYSVIYLALMSRRTMRGVGRPGRL